VVLVTLAGCRCTRLGDEIEGQPFTRCSAIDAPSERTWQAGALSLSVSERVLSLRAPSTLRIAAFTGPVGTALEPDDLARLTQAQPGLVLYLGGLGDDEATATANLRALARLRVPTLFVAGGADRKSVFDAAFGALGDEERDYVLQASGLRELRIGSDRFVLVAGAVGARYAIDAQGCGLSPRDLEAIEEAARESPASAHTWLVSWQAPAGWGVARGAGDVELGSPALQAVATAVGAEGGLFAYPEVQVDRSGSSPVTRVVPRLGRVGSRRADGSLLPAGIATFVWTAQGLTPTP